MRNGEENRFCIEKSKKSESARKNCEEEDGECRARITQWCEILLIPLEKNGNGIFHFIELNLDWTGSISIQFNEVQNSKPDFLSFVVCSQRVIPFMILSLDIQNMIWTKNETCEIKNKLKQQKKYCTLINITMYKIKRIGTQIILWAKKASVFV